MNGRCRSDFGTLNFPWVVFGMYLADWLGRGAQRPLSSVCTLRWKGTGPNKQPRMPTPFSDKNLPRRMAFNNHSMSQRYSREGEEEHATNRNSFPLLCIDLSRRICKASENKLVNLQNGVGSSPYAQVVGQQEKHNESRIFHLGPGVYGNKPLHHDILGDPDSPDNADAPVALRSARHSRHLHPPTRRESRPTDDEGHRAQARKIGFSCPPGAPTKLRSLPSPGRCSNPLFVARYCFEQRLGPF